MIIWDEANNWNKGYSKSEAMLKINKILEKELDRLYKEKKLFIITLENKENNR